MKRLKKSFPGGISIPKGEIGAKKEAIEVSERYYITGAQIGIIRANLSRGIISINDLLDEIEDNQVLL